MTIFSRNATVEWIQYKSVVENVYKIFVHDFYDSSVLHYPTYMVTKN